MFGQAQQQQQQQNPDNLLVDPPADSVSKLLFSPQVFNGNHILAVASWDGIVRLYNVNASGQSQKGFEYKHDGPVLDLAWSPDGRYLFSAGCDNFVRRFDMADPNNVQIVAKHGNVVRCVRFIDQNGGMLVTAGWDAKLFYWNLQSDQPVGYMDLEDKAVSMDTHGKLLVVAVGSRKIHVIDLSINLYQSLGGKAQISPLKWQTRVVACVPWIQGVSQPGHEAFAIGSIEGRVSIQHPFWQPRDAKEAKPDYSFKCHRYDAKATTDTSANMGAQHVFAINTIDFHPTIGTFVTGGSDGSMSIWDGFGRTKVKVFPLKDLNNGNAEAPGEPQWGTPIVSTSFCRNHDILAYAMSYDWSKGHEGAPAEGTSVTKVYIRVITQKTEIARKPKAR